VLVFAQARLLVPEAPPGIYNLVLIQVTEEGAAPVVPAEDMPTFEVTAG
jgi:hypothetical protein